MHRVITVAVTLLALSTGSAVAGPPAINQLVRARLEKGEVIVREVPPTNDEGVAAKAMAIVDAPPVKVWPVVRDCQYFKDFMPRTEDSRLIERKPGQSRCRVEIAMPFPFSNLWSIVTAVEEERPDGSFARRWKLDEGTYARNNGSWELFPWGDDGQRTLLIYSVDANPDISIPDWIIRSAQTGALPDLFQSVRKRVRRS
ncbi:MAG: hypothetical protein KC620_08380 [Myxococcales bacterium]|nr:hypothetical protein [Myxococcales bacterium]